MSSIQRDTRQNNITEIIKDIISVCTYSHMQKYTEKIAKAKEIASAIFAERARVCLEATPQCKLVKAHSPQGKQSVATVLETDV